MKTAIRLTVFTILFVSFAASADPLPDGWFMPNEAGWFESHGQPCPVVCKDEASYSEGEGYYVPRLENTRTYVCKVRNYDSYPFAQKGWLYGNNFNSHNYAPYFLLL